MAGGLAGAGHRALLVGWTYLPFWARRIAIYILFPRFRLVVAGVVRDDAGRVLLARPDRRTAWNVPRAPLRRSETPGRAIVRAIRETTGLRALVGRALIVDQDARGTIRITFECRPADRSSMRLKNVGDRVAFFEPTGLPALEERSRHLLREALAAMDGPLVDRTGGRTARSAIAGHGESGRGTG